MAVTSQRDVGYGIPVLLSPYLHRVRSCAVQPAMPARLTTSERWFAARGGGFMMRPYRDIATLAGAQVVCFLFLTRLEPAFFFVHLYQSILYIAILVMLFYMEDRWAYMIGMLASVVWLGM